MDSQLARFPSAASFITINSTGDLVTLSGFNRFALLPISFLLLGERVWETQN